MPLLSRNPAWFKSPADPPALHAAGESDRTPGRAPVIPARPGPVHSRPGFFETCANPRCGSGRLKLWRGRRMPVFEGGWCCSLACTRARLEAAIGREMDARGKPQASRRHRIPLGLTMLEQGWISSGQLREALEAQKAAGAGRLGAWLVLQQAASEAQVTRALGLQWSCPVLGLEAHDAEAMTGLLPRLFVDAFQALPLRVAAGKILYLGFEDRPDPVLALAIERMTGLRVESVLVESSAFCPAQARMLAARYPRAGLIEASSSLVLADALLQTMERVCPADARLARVHDCLWLRMWLRPQREPLPPHDAVEDLICSTAGG